MSLYSTSPPTYQLSLKLPANFDWPGGQTFTRNLECRAPGIAITECSVDGDDVKITCTSGKLRSAVEKCLRKALQSIVTGSPPKQETLTGNLGVVDKPEYPPHPAFAISSGATMEGCS